MATHPGPPDAKLRRGGFPEGVPIPVSFVGMMTPKQRREMENAAALAASLRKVTANLRSSIEDEVPEPDVDRACEEMGVLEAEALLKRIHDGAP